MLLAEKKAKKCWVNCGFLEGHSGDGLENWQVMASALVIVMFFEAVKNFATLPAAVFALQSDFCRRFGFDTIN